MIYCLWGNIHRARQLYSGRIAKPDLPHHIGGEFGFVLLTLAQANALVPPALLNPILAQ